MKKFLLIFFILLVSSQTIYAEDNINNKWSAKQTKIIIYERYINAKTYDSLSNNSIWKQNEEYSALLLQSLNSKEIIKIIKIEKE